LIELIIICVILIGETLCVIGASNSGGILSIWSKAKGKPLFSSSGVCFLGVYLDWGVYTRRCFLVNIYHVIFGGEKKYAGPINSLEGFLRRGYLVFSW